MAKKKKKPKRFRAVTAVKAMARATLGQPPSTRRDSDDKKKSRSKSTKHKPTLSKLLATEE